MLVGIIGKLKNEINMETSVNKIRWTLKVHLFCYKNSSKIISFYEIPFFNNSDKWTSKNSFKLK